MTTRTLAKTATILGIVVFLLVGSFGMSHVGMSTGDGQMSDCPFTPGVAICNMTPLEMIAASQSMLNSILPQQKDIASLLLLLVAAVFAAVFWKPFSPPRISLRRIPLASSREYVPVHNYLQEAFSNGILNPKLF